MKRDLRKAEEEEKRREKANNREEWDKITKVVVNKRKDHIISFNYIYLFKRYVQYLYA